MIKTVFFYTHRELLLTHITLKVRVHLVKSPFWLNINQILKMRFMSFSLDGVCHAKSIFWFNDCIHLLREITLDAKISRHKKHLIKKSKNKLDLEPLILFNSRKIDFNRFIDNFDLLKHLIPQLSLFEKKKQSNMHSCCKM